MDWHPLADSSAIGVDIGALGQYGAIGIICSLLLWFAKTSYKRETDGRDRAEAEIAEHNKWVKDTALPALLASERANEESRELLKEMHRALEELHDRPPPA